MDFKDMDFKEAWQQFWMDVAYLRVCDERSAFAAFWIVLWDGIVHLFHWYVTCKLFDHDYQDEGYAGPESGYESVSCKRCGYGWHHTYY